MIAVFQINSIPLKDVIKSLAKSFGVEHYHDGDEYYLYLPEHIGVGEIRGTDFECGLSLLIYKVFFNEDMRLEFTLNEVHPVKFTYSLEGLLVHEFEDEGLKYPIAEYRGAIVASRSKNGHILEFAKETQYEILSVEIDRKTFGAKAHYELSNWDSRLQTVLRDVKGSEQFFHIENSGLFFKHILVDSQKYKDFPLARMFNLQSLTMQMFIAQIVQFDDDSLAASHRLILRISELKRVEEIAEYIRSNIADDHTIKNLARKTGLNPTKLQTGFKHLFSDSVNGFVINARLSHAYTLLQDNEYSVGDVVLAVGLESNSYFTRIFKRKYGITPFDFRKAFL